MNLFNDIKTIKSSPLTSFDFSLNAINIVFEEVSNAKEYIKIAVFQIHHKQLFELLIQKLKQNVQVEIITLPYDSIYDSVRLVVEGLFEELIRNGGKVYFNKWNVGDPERTSTAVGKWYSYHGKFIVTDKAAIALSANFTQEIQLDACLIYKNDPNKLKEFKNKFEYLKELFVTESNGNDGIIKEKILATKIVGVNEVFRLPKVIETKTHTNNWIQEYPNDLCPENIAINDGLYICPFDVKARNLIETIIKDANQYIYISTESFTDPEIINILKKATLRKIEMKLLTGSTSMDFTERLQNSFRYLLSSGVQIRNTKESLHAKLLITDKALLVTSVNLNKMNLGFKKSSKYWRADTETIDICLKSEIITSAKNKFDAIFELESDIFINLVEKIKKEVTNTFINLFGLSTKSDVKEVIAKFILNEEIKLKHKVHKICEFISMMTIKNKKRTVIMEDVIKGFIVYFLSNRKLTFNEIKEKLSVIGIKFNLKELLSNLENVKIIEQEKSYYKLNITSLI